MEGQTMQWSKEKGQTMKYKTQHRKLKIKQHKPH